MNDMTSNSAGANTVLELNRFWPRAKDHLRTHIAVGLDPDEILFAVLQGQKVQWCDWIISATPAQHLILPDGQETMVSTLYVTTTLGYCSYIGVNLDNVARACSYIQTIQDRAKEQPLQAHRDSPAGNAPLITSNGYSQINSQLNSQIYGQPSTVGSMQSQSIGQA